MTLKRAPFNCSETKSRKKHNLWRHCLEVKRSWCPAALRNVSLRGDAEELCHQSNKGMQATKKLKWSLNDSLKPIKGDQKFGAGYAFWIVYSSQLYLRITRADCGSYKTEWRAFIEGPAMQTCRVRSQFFCLEEADLDSGWFNRLEANSCNSLCFRSRFVRFLFPPVGCSCHSCWQR